MDYGALVPIARDMYRPEERLALFESMQAGSDAS
jgi:hypothetical protein